MDDYSHSLQHLNSVNQINTATDSRRLEILRLLMTKPSTVSQIGRQLNEFPAAIRYHIQKLIDAQLVELSETRISAGFTEKYYAAKADAISIQRIILPMSDQKSIIFMGSHDIGWEKIVKNFYIASPHVKIYTFPVGSLNGLIALQQGLCNVTGCHVLDPGTQQYNIPQVKMLFPGRDVQIIRLANRVQGLLFAQDNPKHISKFEDVSRSDLRFINRNPGSGTRIWLDQKIKDLAIPFDQINGYTKELNSHTAVAQAIQSGLADFGLGLIAAGYQFNLSSIPLFEEQYDLIIPYPANIDFEIANLIDYLMSHQGRTMIGKLPGYDTSQTGNLTNIN